MMSRDESLPADYRHVVSACAGATCVVASMAFLGWVANRPLFAQLHPDYNPIAPVTCVLIFGFAVCILWLAHGNRRGAGLSLAIRLLAGASVTVMIGCGFGLTEEVEHVLLSGLVVEHRGVHGHISPVTAACLVLVGVSLLGQTDLSRRLTQFSGGLAVAVTATGSITLLGYLYGMPLLYGGRFLPVALPTALALVLLGVSLLVVGGPQSWPLRLVIGDSVAARLSRALLPIMLGLVVTANGAAIFLVRAGINPVLGVAIEALVCIWALMAITVFVARGVGRRIQAADAARRATEDGFRLFYENSPVPFHSLDACGRFLEVNQAFLDTLCYRRDEIIGQPAAKIMTPEGARQFIDCFERYKQTGLSFAEYVFVRKDGEHRHVSLNARLSRTPEGDFVRDYCVWTDITDRKKTELAMAEAKQAAEEASHAKDHLLATVSHELRTPLTPVLVTLSMWEEDKTLPSPLLSSISMMRGRIELEAKLIDGLLDLTRMTRGKVKLKPERIDVHCIIEQALALAVQDADAYRPAVDRQLLAHNHFVWADPVRLQQVCWNIIKNALQHTPDSGSLCIRSRNLPGDVLEIEFRDTGCGIAPDFFPRLFHEFERAPAADHRRARGLGVGLSIAKTLIEQLGGSITAHSDGLGKGSTFTLRLPQASIAASPQTPSATGSDPAAPAPVPIAYGQANADLPSGGGMRLLLVEDDAETAEILAKALRGMGYQVTTAATVRQAIEAGERGKFDLLLSDIGLPDGSGLDVMRWFVKWQPIPAIALSGYAAPSDVQRSEAQGFAMHLIKPIAVGALREAIAEVRRSGCILEEVGGA